jgi:hypothetical protein
MTYLPMRNGLIARYENADGPAKEFFDLALA